MLTESLFERILVEPVTQNADTLYVISGYASATMVSKHFNKLIGNRRRRRRFIRRKEVRVKLIVGMAVQDGISEKDHKGFQELTKDYNDLFTCRYVAYRPPVHSKIYLWYSGDIPIVGFTGSANYTQAGFSISRREAMLAHDPELARGYFDLIRQDTVDCHDTRVGNLITIFSEPRHSIEMMSENGDEFEGDGNAIGISDDLARLPHVRISLLDNQGSLPQRSGLNWGQRPEVGREPNQAYLRVPLPIASTPFFPPIGDHFTIITDDNKAILCVRAQTYGKAIHTPDSNSKMGIYFRYRLGLPEGYKVQKEDLDLYGRSDIDFYKIDEETYFMDFSV